MNEYNYTIIPPTKLPKWITKLYYIAQNSLYLNQNTHAHLSSLDVLYKPQKDWS